MDGRSDRAQPLFCTDAPVVRHDKHRDGGMRGRLQPLVSVAASVVPWQPSQLGPLQLAASTPQFSVRVACRGIRLAWNFMRLACDLHVGPRTCMRLHGSNLLARPRTCDLHETSCGLCLSSSCQLGPSQLAASTPAFSAHSSIGAGQLAANMELAGNLHGTRMELAWCLHGACMVLA